MSTRTDALVSQQETGKITASIDPCYGRLSPGTHPATIKLRACSAAFVIQPVERDVFKSRENPSHYHTACTTLDCRVE